MKKPPQIWSQKEITDTLGCAVRENPLAPLNTHKVPLALKALLHYAEIWGIPDDGYRENLIQSASHKSLENLADVFFHFENALMEWLSGPESDAPELTNEYIAFSAFLQAGELAAIKLGKT